MKDAILYTNSNWSISRKASMRVRNCPAGIVSELVWSVKNTASGVYQYRVEARSASGTKSLVKRLAVIH